MDHSSNARFETVGVEISKIYYHEYILILEIFRRLTLCVRVLIAQDYVRASHYVAVMKLHLPMT